jgi:hypothetical protein
MTIFVHRAGGGFIQINQTLGSALNVMKENFAQGP